MRQIIQYDQHTVHEKYFLVSNNDNTKHCCDVNLIKNCEEGDPQLVERKKNCVDYFHNAMICLSEKRFVF